MTAAQRIVLVLGSSAGGVGSHIVGLARELTARGHRIGVIGPAGTDEQFHFSQIPGVRFAPVEIPATLSLSEHEAVSRLRSLLQSFHADVVHAHGFRAGLITALAVRRMRRSRRPRFISSWHNAILSTGLRRRAEELVAGLIARRADVVLGASDDLVGQALDLGARRARFAPAAAPVPAFGGDVNLDLARRRIATELGLAPGTVMVLTVGRVAPQKDFDTLLDAAAIWREDHPEIVSVIAGGADPALLERLRTRVRDEDLPVKFLGQRGDVAELTLAADLILLTSLWEARALVVQEAMMAGRAVVATRVGGIPALLGDAGVMVAPRDAEGVARAVIDLAQDPELRAELGRRASERAVDLPDEPEVARLIESFYIEPNAAEESVPR